MFKFLFFVAAILLCFSTHLIAQDQADDYLFFTPHAESDELIVRVNIHVIQKTKDDPRNFSDQEPDITYLKNIIGEINGHLGINEIFANLKPGVFAGKALDNEYIADSKIRFLLRKIYFDVDSLGWNYNHNTGVPNICSSYCFDKWKRKETKEINIFLVGNATPPIPHKIQGCGPSMAYAVLYGLWEVFSDHPPGELDASPWGGQSWNDWPLVAHEMGHCLGLNHTYEVHQFSDTPQEKYCGWCDANKDPCANNIMNYSRSKENFTPMQLAWMRYLLKTKGTQYLDD